LKKGSKVVEKEKKLFGGWMLDGDGGEQSCGDDCG